MSGHHSRKNKDKYRNKKPPPIIPPAPSSIPEHLLNNPPIPPPPPLFIRQHDKEKEDESTIKEDEGSDKGEPSNSLSLPVESGRLIRSRHVKFRGELPEENLEREVLPDNCSEFNDYDNTEKFLNYKPTKSIVDKNIFEEYKDVFTSRYSSVALCFNKIGDENIKNMIIAFFKSYNELNGKIKYFVYYVNEIPKVGILHNDLNRNLLINSDGRNPRVNKLMEIFKKKESLGLPNIYNEMIDEPI